MRFIELFAGIGGFRYGLEKANNNTQSATEKSESTEPQIQHRGEWPSDKERRDKLSGLSQRGFYITASSVIIEVF